MKRIVLAVGNPYRADDGVGPRIARTLADLRRADFEVQVVSSPARLADAWKGASSVVIVDAMHTGRPPGTLLVHDAKTAPLPFGTGSAGTHAFGLAAAVELARTLGTLPDRLTVVAVEAQSSTLGERLSPAVESAVGPASQAALAALG